MREQVAGIDPEGDRLCDAGLGIQACEILQHTVLLSAITLDGAAMKHGLHVVAIL